MALTKRKLEATKGKTLNRVAGMYGLKRRFLESDKRLRKRILLAATERW